MVHRSSRSMVASEGGYLNRGSYKVVCRP